MANPEFLDPAGFYSPGPHISPEEFEEAVLAAKDVLTAAANDGASQDEAAAQLEQLLRKS